MRRALPRRGRRRSDDPVDADTDAARTLHERKKTVGIVGARGHTGAELIRLVARHPSLELAFVSSRELDGERVADHVDEFDGDLRYENLGAEAVAVRSADAVDARAAERQVDRLREPDRRRTSRRR